MPQQIQAGENFVNGDMVDDDRLNGHVNNAQLLVGAIHGRDFITTKTLSTNDEFLIYRAADNALRVTNATDILRSNLPIEASTITTTGITTFGGNVNVTGNIAITGNITATGNITVSGTLEVGNATINGRINGTGAIAVSSGTNEQRPSNPLTGAVRFNTTRGTLEVYNGTSWISAGAGYNGLPVYGVFEFVTGSGGFGFVSTGTVGSYSGGRYQTATPLTKTDKERWELNIQAITNMYELGGIPGPENRLYSIKLIGSNGVTYASKTFSFTLHEVYIEPYQGPEGGPSPYWEVQDDGKRVPAITGIVLGPEITFTNVTLAVVVVTMYAPTVSKCLVSPQSSVYSASQGVYDDVVSAYILTQSTSGKKWVSP